MKGLGVRVIELGMLALAAVIALELASRWGPFTLFNTKLDPSQLTGFVVFGLYGAILVVSPLAALPWPRKYFDPRAKFIGTYASLAADGTTISLFEIRREFFRPRYRLEGYWYNRSNVGQSTGNWTSDLLDFDIKGNVLRYIYTGGPLRGAGGQHGPHQGNGYARINFLDPRLTQGTGSFVDDASGAEWRASRYIKVDRRLVRRHLGRWRRLSHRHYATFLSSYVRSLPVAGRP